MINELPPWRTVCKKIPFPNDFANQQKLFRNTSIEIIQNESKKVALFIGPCSIHNEEEMLCYGQLFAKLQKKVKDSFFLVMRAFVEKPRTKGGWRGFINDPYLDSSYDIEAGIYKTRELFSQLVQLGIPLCSELLDPLLFYYYQDFLAWGFIGARTSSSQVHRIVASRYAFPIGFKNGLDGCTQSAINGIQVAKQSHKHLGVNENGKVFVERTRGNPFAHLVLRGSSNSNNYEKECIQNAKRKLLKEKSNPAIIVDCSHGNALQKPSSQIEAFQSVVSQINDGDRSIKGLMLESYLQKGSQPITQRLQPGISITDPCLDWQTTENLVLWAYDLFKKNRSYSSSNSIFSVHN